MSPKNLLGLQKNIPLAPYTTFKIGGPAEYFFEAKTKKEIIKAILWAKKQGLPFFILGGGSNMLVADKGFDGVAIKIKNQKSKIKMANQNVKRIEAEAGASLSQVLVLALKNNLTGLEWAAGIPGTVGGAIRGNAGGFGGSMADIVKTIEILEILENKVESSKLKVKSHSSKLKVREIKNRDCKFKYRDSIFKNNKNLIILSVVFQLKKGRKLEIEKKIREYLNYRKKTQPLQFPSAGSVFKNCELRIANYGLLKKYPEFEEFHKKGMVPAGFLIERAGLKGKRIGRAQISEKHANFIVNLGGAKARDVVALIELIKREVKAKFGITLKEEVQYLGDG